MPVASLNRRAGPTTTIPPSLSLGESATQPLPARIAAVDVDVVGRDGAPKRIRVDLGSVVGLVPTKVTFRCEWWGQGDESPRASFKLALPEPGRMTMCDG
jgi:hypothetical protein